MSSSAKSSVSVELVVDAKRILPEGPIWCAATRRLYWVNILGSELHWYDPATKQDSFADVGSHVGTVVPRAKGGVTLAIQSGFAHFDPASKKLTKLAQPEADHPGIRFNDGKCDPAGRLWAGTLSYDNAKGVGALYRLDADGSVTVMERNISCSNGLAWDLEKKRFYYIDTPTRAIAAYDYDNATGRISNKRMAVTMAPEEGWPDGMCIDVEGKLWVAHWGGSQVVRWDPETGKAIARITTPVSQPSACAFGGDKLDRLYITTAREGMKPEQIAKEPTSGGLFVCDPGMTGRPQPTFAG
jgi:sugar lactone lactonase YvrE